MGARVQSKAFRMCREVHRVEFAKRAKRGRNKCGQGQGSAASAVPDARHRVRAWRQDAWPGEQGWILGSRDCLFTCSSDSRVCSVSSPDF